MTRSPKVRIKDILDSQGDFEILDKSEYTLLPSQFVKEQSSGPIFVDIEIKEHGKKVSDQTRNISHDAIGNLIEYTPQKEFTPLFLHKKQAEDFGFISPNKISFVN